MGRGKFVVYSRHGNSDNRLRLTVELNLHCANNLSVLIDKIL